MELREASDLEDSSEDVSDSLGSIFDDAPQGEGRGPDLHATVEVPRAGLGGPEGVVVSLPPSLPHEGESVARTRQPGDPEDAITLHLPDTFTDGATLRLRGSGARGPGGCGDLYLKIKLVDGEPVRPAVRPRAEISERSEESSSSLFVIIVVAAAIALVYALVLR